MAIQNTSTLTTVGGLTVPTLNLVVSAIHFPTPTLVVSEDGKWTGDIVRPITYDLFVYQSKNEVQNPKGNNVGEVIEFPSGWQKNMTPNEYKSLLADGTLAETWLKDYINGIIGGTSNIIDPYV